MTHAPEPSGTFRSEPSPDRVWWWRLENEAGDEVAPQAAGSDDAPRFASQGDAESWVGEVWADLAEKGVDAVTLFESERRVYGPMSLHA